MSINERLAQVRRAKANDGAEALAEKAYLIYRGMSLDDPPPHWEMLTNKERGLFTWIVRFTRMQ
jgi:hypothetical protein